MRSLHALTPRRTLAALAAALTFCLSCLPPEGTQPPPQSGGSVQVHGYTRSNGTYVAPHTRSAPSRR